MCYPKHFSEIQWNSLEYYYPHFKDKHETWSHTACLFLHCWLCPRTHLLTTATLTSKQTFCKCLISVYSWKGLWDFSCPGGTCLQKHKYLSIPDCLTEVKSPAGALGRGRVLFWGGVAHKAAQIQKGCVWGHEDFKGFCEGATVEESCQFARRIFTAYQVIRLNFTIWRKIDRFLKRNLLRGLC